jgi:hypothetical protein
MVEWTSTLIKQSHLVRSCLSTEKLSEVWLAGIGNANRVYDVPQIFCSGEHAEDQNWVFPNRISFTVGRTSKPILGLVAHSEVARHQKLSMFSRNFPVGLLQTLAFIYSTPLCPRHPGESYGMHRSICAVQSNSYFFLCFLCNLQVQIRGTPRSEPCHSLHHEFASSKRFYSGMRLVSSN